MQFKEFMLSLGYDTITTFWSDFSIADIFGERAIKDTFERAFNEWKYDYKYLTELVMVLNHKIWFYYGKDNELSLLYNDLYIKARDYAEENLEGDELEYYFRITD